MRKVIIPIKLLLAGAALFLLAVSCNGALSTGGEWTSRMGISSADRADIITIDRQGAGFEKRTGASVTFLHDLHTTKLGDEAADCAACHGRTAREFFDWNMLGTTGLSGDALRDAYHNACFSCHRRKAAGAPDAGPEGRDTTQCANCHVEELPFKSIAMQVRMPQPLHNLHNTSALIKPLAGQEKNCSNCHHSLVDKVSGALVLEKGKEQPCFSCHLQEKKDNIPSAPVAAHQTCLTCHVQFKREGISAGPSNCSTCHAVPLVLERKYVDDPERGLESLSRW